MENKKYYSIWIKKEYDETYDINVWNEDCDERAEDMEIAYIINFELAQILLDSVIHNNPTIYFERRDDYIG